MQNKKIIGPANKILSRFGYRLVKAQSETKFRSQHVHDPQYSYMEDPRLRDELIQDLSDIAWPFFTKHLPGLMVSRADIKEHISRFFSTYMNRSLSNNTGGSGFHNAFWLYLLSTALQPVLIIESGVWKGHTTWLFTEACPAAKIIGFDINLKHLEFQHPAATFVEADWSTYPVGSIDPEKSLIFFDCHVNHAQRIIEAAERGFKHLLFDDNPPLDRLFSYGQPGYPTAQMLLDPDQLSPEPISWVWKGKKHQAVLDLDQALQASRLIRNHLLFPDVGGPTRYGGFSFLTYVQL